MPCHTPVPASSDALGRITVQYSGWHARNTMDKSLEVACGRCESCRAAKARSWAIRCSHEAQLHTRPTYLGPVSNNSFITLTYAEAPSELIKRDFQLFIKRLRKNTGQKIRYFQCGEYGSRRGRAHFHALLFGIDFHEDRTLLHTAEGTTLYQSPTLDQAWQNKGYAYVGPLNFATASYVAGYAAKKLRQAEHANTGVWVANQLVTPQQEYITMSRGTGKKTGPFRKGLAFDWIEQHWPEVYPHDEIAINGKTFRPPSYYDDYLRDHFPCKWEEVLHARRLYAESVGLSTPLQLSARKANYQSQNSIKSRQRHEDFDSIDGSRYA